MFPLAQLGDAVPAWVFWLVAVAGMLAPIGGLMMSVAWGTTSRAIRIAVVTYYLVALPLVWLVFLPRSVVVLPRSGGPFEACSFLAMIPAGFILGVVVVASSGARGRREPPGFEIVPKRQDGDAD